MRRKKYQPNENGFINFLKDRKVHEKFMKAFDRSDWTCLSFDKYLKDTEPNYYIYSAFDWEENGGFDYWEDVDNCWIGGIK